MPSKPQSPDTDQIRDSPNELFVSWEHPLEPNGIITSYSVYCYEAYDSEIGSAYSSEERDFLEEPLVTVPGGVTEAVVTELIPYTFYNCYVTANTSAGEGNASDSTTARTDESGTV